MGRCARGVPGSLFRTGSIVSTGELHQAFLHPERSAQRESNPHVRPGEATGCRYIMGTAFRRRIVKEQKSSG